MSKRKPDGVDRFREVGFSENPYLTDEVKTELAQSHLEAQKQPESAAEAPSGINKARKSIENLPSTIGVMGLRAGLSHLLDGQIGYNAEREQKAIIETALRTNGTDLHRPEPAILRLNPRQLEVLAIIASGGSYVDVSEKLDINRTTARAHLGDIRAKLGAKTLAHAVALAMRSGQLP